MKIGFHILIRKILKVSCKGPKACNTPADSITILHFRFPTNRVERKVLLGQRNKIKCRMYNMYHLVNVLKVITFCYTSPRKEEKYHDDTIVQTININACVR